MKRMALIESSSDPAPSQTQDARVVDPAIAAILLYRLSLLNKLQKESVMPSMCCHPQAPHKKLRVPDWFASSLMMDRALDAIPGIDASFSQPIRDNILESISQIDGQIVVKVFGDDLGVLRDMGQKVLAAIADVPGVARAMIDRQGGRT